MNQLKVGLDLRSVDVEGASDCVDGSVGTEGDQLLNLLGDLWDYIDHFTRAKVPNCLPS